MKRQFTVKLVCTTHQLPLLLSPGKEGLVWDQTGPGQWTLDRDGLICVGEGKHDFMVTAAWEKPDPPMIWNWKCPHCPFETESLTEGAAHVTPYGYVCGGKF